MKGLTIKQGQKKSAKSEFMVDPLQDQERNMNND